MQFMLSYTAFLFLKDYNNFQEERMTPLCDKGIHFYIDIISITNNKIHDMPEHILVNRDGKGFISVSVQC